MCLIPCVSRWLQKDNLEPLSSWKEFWASHFEILQKLSGSRQASEFMDFSLCKFLLTHSLDISSSSISSSSISIFKHFHLQARHFHEPASHHTVISSDCHFIKSHAILQTSRSIEHALTVHNHQATRHQNVIHLQNDLDVISCLIFSGTDSTFWSVSPAFSFF
jgi:hypothetical protein